MLRLLTAGLGLGLILNSCGSGGTPPSVAILTPISEAAVTGTMDVQVTLDTQEAGTVTVYARARGGIDWERDRMASRYSRAQLAFFQLAPGPLASGRTAFTAGDGPTLRDSVNTVSRWRKRLKRIGSLQATVMTGRPSRLPVPQREQVRTPLREGAPQHGFPDQTRSTKRPRTCSDGSSTGGFLSRSCVRTERLPCIHKFTHTPGVGQGVSLEERHPKIQGLPQILREATRIRPRSSSPASSDGATAQARSVHTTP
ncbi:hypothetical protein DGo_PF0003 (plasmid) [Deinococcus gobiensis I-0]|uniref:Uncharacterized protein n=1 Tax=Deinococcus gobiensis (strain DSM 21396 / JCM 16679 / CGMCC 1.7299 / I-0) TaxID=745776 RepID=H8H3X9_DEIGI|nr:hypothetical protein DGo_PF0003 [Deinococcus gobiensis I-0]